jgi:hypothetical protein
MGMSLRAAGEDMNNIHHTMNGVWARKTHEMQQARSLCSGPLSALLQPMQDELQRFMFELCEQGMPVSISMVALKASQLSPAFSLKSRIELQRGLIEPTVLCIDLKLTNLYAQPRKMTTVA